jgi:hypothetical protein
MAIEDFTVGLVLGALIIAGPQVLLYIRRLKNQIAFLDGHQVETATKSGSRTFGTKKTET